MKDMIIVDDPINSDHPIDAHKVTDWIKRTLAPRVNSNSPHIIITGKLFDANELNDCIGVKA